MTDRQTDRQTESRIPWHHIRMGVFFSPVKIFYLPTRFARRGKKQSWNIFDKPCLFLQVQPTTFSWFDEGEICRASRSIFTSRQRWHRIHQSSGLEKCFQIYGANKVIAKPAANGFKQHLTFWWIGNYKKISPYNLLV